MLWSHWHIPSTTQCFLWIHSWMYKRQGLKSTSLLTGRKQNHIETRPFHTFKECWIPMCVHKNTKASENATCICMFVNDNQFVLVYHILINYTILLSWSWSLSLWSWHLIKLFSRSHIACLFQKLLEVLSESAENFRMRNWDYTHTFMSNYNILEMQYGK